MLFRENRLIRFSRLAQRLLTCTTTTTLRLTLLIRLLQESNTPLLLHRLHRPSPGGRSGGTARQCPQASSLALGLPLRLSQWDRLFHHRRRQSFPDTNQTFNVFNLFLILLHCSDFKLAENWGTRITQ